MPDDAPVQKSNNIEEVAINATQVRLMKLGGIA
jgi:hypothetical protein